MCASESSSACICLHVTGCPTTGLEVFTRFYIVLTARFVIIRFVINHFLFICFMIICFMITCFMITCFMIIRF